MIHVAEKHTQRKGFQLGFQEHSFPVPRLGVDLPLALCLTLLLARDRFP